MECATMRPAMLITRATFRGHRVRAQTAQRETSLEDADLGFCKHRPPVQVEPLCSASAYSVDLVSVRDRRCRVNVIADGLIRLEKKRTVTQATPLAFTIVTRVKYGW